MATTVNTAVPAGNASSGRVGESKTLDRTADGDAGTDSQNPTLESTAVRRPADLLPDRRQYNPLSIFSSYTYALTLYMITPDAYNAFVLTNRTDINSFGPGAYIVAQSGGVADPAKRAPEFDYDFFIDDLKITSIPNSKISRTSSNLTEMSFKIIEPQGFSFLTKLKNANMALQKVSKLQHYMSSNDPIKQFFVLGIAFKGYDKNGKVMTNADLNTQDSFGSPNDEISNRYYDIYISSMKFKLDGKASIYSITATPVNLISAYGLKHGRLPHEVTIKASTVGEAIGGLGSDGRGDIQGLLPALNDYQKDLVAPKDGTPAKNKFANVYKIDWRSAGADPIKGASIVSAAFTDKSSIPMSTVEFSYMSNEATAQTASPDPTKRTFTFKNDSSIMQCIELIIKQSSYLENALNTLKMNQKEQADPNIKHNQIENGNKPLSWYNLSAEVQVIDYDPSIKDYAYAITYVIQPYAVPAIRSPLLVGNTKYYGPHKRYDYWLTGQNSEILSFEQVLDNAYTNVVLNNSDTISGNPAASVTNQRNDQNTQGAHGSGNEFQNSIVSLLTDPKHWAEAKIKILGDPDYLIQDAPGPSNTIYRQFYGDDNFTINANGAEVFFEIGFKESKDYDPVSGVLGINEAVSMWNYSGTIASAIRGVSYMLVEIVSTFSKGAFTQELTGFLTPFDDFTNAETDVSTDPAAAAGREAANEVLRETRPNNGAATPNVYSQAKDSQAAYADDDKTSPNTVATATTQNTREPTLSAQSLADMGGGRGT